MHDICFPFFKSYDKMFLLGDTMRIVNLFSGSKGNCTFVGSANTKILIDAGKTAKKIVSELESIGEKMSDIRAILVTHEHDDHIHAIKSLAKSYNFDVFVHKNLLSSGDFMALGVEEGRIHTFDENAFEVGDLEIVPFKIFHDSVSPVGFCVGVKSSEAKVGFVMDTGTFDETMVKALKKAKIVFIEANYDENLLRNGNYPAQIKRRIASDHGHLSNAQSLEFAKRLFKGGTKCFVLSHISENNNSREIAYSNYADYFAGGGYEIEKDVILRVTFQNKHGNNFILNEDFDGK